MVIFKGSDAIKGPIVKVDDLLCGGLYKEDHGYIFTWSVTYPDTKMNCFNWYKEDNDWIIPGCSTMNRSRTG